MKKKTVEELIKALQDEASEEAQERMLEAWEWEPSSLWDRFENAFGRKRAAEIVICLLGDAFTNGAIVSRREIDDVDDEPVQLKTDVNGDYEESRIHVGDRVILEVDVED